MIKSKVVENEPSLNLEKRETLLAQWIDSPLGPLIAISEKKELVLLEFVDRKKLKLGLEKLQNKTHKTIAFGTNHILTSIKEELYFYFKGELKEFLTPVKTLGTSFQKGVWEQLKKIPFGETRSYLDIAQSINNPKAMRAIGNANGLNQLAIIIPCHRVIKNNGIIGGYGGGASKKAWLLDHEAKSKK